MQYNRSASLASRTMEITRNTFSAIARTDDPFRAVVRGGSLMAASALVASAIATALPIKANAQYYPYGYPYFCPPGTQQIIAPSYLPPYYVLECVRNVYFGPNGWGGSWGRVEGWHGGMSHGAISMPRGMIGGGNGAGGRTSGGRHK